MAMLSKLILLLLFVASGTLHATPSLVTTPGALGANDVVNWSQLGADGTTINQNFLAASTGLRSVSGHLGGSDGCLAVVGGSVCSWAAGPGFAAGNSVLWAENASGVGSGPLAFSFASLFGAGLWMQANALGQFTASMQVFNGASLLATLTETSDAAGDGIFIGALDTVSEITGITLSLTSCGNNSQGCDLGDFAVNSLMLRSTAPARVPEPTSLSLLLLGGAGLAMFRRSRKMRGLVATEEKSA
jgi:hypothetical protein